MPFSKSGNVTKWQSTLPGMSEDLSSSLALEGKEEGEKVLKKGKQEKKSMNFIGFSSHLPQ